MKLKFFTIPAASPEAAEADLNRFLGAHRVSHRERHFTAGESAGPHSGPYGSRVDRRVRCADR